MDRLIDTRTFVRRVVQLLRDPQPSAHARAEVAKAAAMLDDSHFAPHIPAAPSTWESRALLTPDMFDTGACILNFSRPVEIVGMHVFCVPAGDFASENLERWFLALRKEALGISLRWHADPPHTEGRRADVAANTDDFVTAASLDSDRRLYMVRIAAANATVTWRACWLLPDTLRSQLPPVDVRLPFFGRYLQ